MAMVVLAASKRLAVIAAVLSKNPLSFRQVAGRFLNSMLFGWFFTPIVSQPWARTMGEAIQLRRQTVKNLFSSVLQTVLQGPLCGNRSLEHTDNPG
jgi:hypothetical protein